VRASKESARKDRRAREKSETIADFHAEIVDAMVELAEILI
jgi:hypothetical protein